MPKFCPNCGTEISDKVKYCPECGVNIDSFSVKKDSSSPPLIKCFFKDCPDNTSRRFYCPLCGHDFCEKHKLHQVHNFISQEKINQPESKSDSSIPKDNGRTLKGNKKSRFAGAFLIIIGILALGFFVINLTPSTTGSVTTAPSLTSACVTKSNAYATTMLPTTIPTILPIATVAKEPLIGVWRCANFNGWDVRFQFNADHTFVEFGTFKKDSGSFINNEWIMFEQSTQTKNGYGTWTNLGNNAYTLHFTTEQSTEPHDPSSVYYENYVYDPIRNVIYNKDSFSLENYSPLLFTPYQGNLVITIASTPTYSSQNPVVTSTIIVYSRPMTGTIVSGNNMYGGEGEFTIDNKRGSSDVVSILTYQNSKTTRFAVFIRKGESYTIYQVNDGIYDLYVLSGVNWNSNNKQFDTNPSRIKFDDSFPFTTSRTSGTTWEVTIYPVIDGNAKTKLISQDDFPRL